MEDPTCTVWPTAEYVSKGTTAAGLAPNRYAAAALLVEQ